MLMRSPAVECDFRTDVCGINQTLEQFEYVFNRSETIDRRFEYYQLAIKRKFRISSILDMFSIIIVISSIADYTPQHMGRFQTILFPNLAYKRGCVHVEYNVQGFNNFIFSIIQQTVDFPKQKIDNLIVHYDWAIPSHSWNRIDIDVNMTGSGSQFAFEAFCEYCIMGSKFSVSRLLFSWSFCDAQILPKNSPYLTFSSNSTKN